MRRTGFTLVELLMVIAIIAVLAGLLIPLIGYAKTAAKNAKCEAQLGTIKAALAVFKDANGFYPEKDFGPLFDNPAKTNATTKYLTVGSKGSSDDRTPKPDWEGVASLLFQALQTVDRDNFRDPNALRDPFTTGSPTNKVLRYRPAKFYPLRPSSTDLYLIDSEDPPNPDSYQLWSAGPDGKDQFGERINGKKSDDVTNWKSP
jgi:prepilin-type N-terminal cleavage/methylation domain-containing protein